MSSYYDNYGIRHNSLIGDYEKALAASKNKYMMIFSIPLVIDILIMLMINTLIPRGWNITKSLWPVILVGGIVAIGIVIGFFIATHINSIKNEIGAKKVYLSAIPNEIHFAYEGTALLKKPKIMDKQAVDKIVEDVAFIVTLANRICLEH